MDTRNSDHTGIMQYRKAVDVIKAAILKSQARAAQAITHEQLALGIEKQTGGTEKEYQWYDKKYYTVENVIGMSKKEATNTLSNFSVE